MEISTSPTVLDRLAFSADEIPLPNETMIKGLPMVRLQTAYLHAITERQTIEIVMQELQEKRGGCIVTMNLDHMRRYDQDEGYRHLCKRATLHVADGMPLIWASAIQGTPLPERVTGSNLIWSLTAAAAENDRSIFFLGGDSDTSHRAASVLSQVFPRLRVAGTYHPEYGFEKSADEITAMKEAIIAANPHIVYVALGSPKQDKLIETLRAHLPAVWWIGVGISFSFVAGDVERAPQWLQQLGFEWLHRLTQDPKRLATRYLVHGLPFCVKLLADAMVKRFTGCR